MTIRQAAAPITDEELVEIAAKSSADRHKNERKSSAYLYPKLSFFFDGTGNNLKKEQAKPKQEQALSNVAKLYIAAMDNQMESQRIFRRYIPGVGTPFNVEPAVSGFKDNGGAAGLALGAGGEMRIRYALHEFNRIMTEEFNPSLWCDIQYISLSVFGFSRGATAARTFVRRFLKEECFYNYGTLVWNAPGQRRVEVKIDFMGLFDTVASVGGPGLHLDWGAQLAVPEEVKRCVHYVAAHEVRSAFPLDSVRVGNSYPKNCEEVVYPGVHSDVGGGYASIYQGRNNLLSRIPLRHMYAAALEAGVMLNGLNQLTRDDRNEFSLAPSSQTAQAFRSYQAQLNATGNDVESLMQAHRVLQFMWRANMTRIGKDEQLLGLLAEKTDQALCKAVAPATDADHPECDPLTWDYANADSTPVQAKRLLSEHRRLVQRVEFLRNPVADPYRSQPGSDYTLTYYDKLILSAWDNVNTSAAVQQIEGLFAYGIHDSVAHFTSWPCALYEPRGVYCDGKKYLASNDTNGWSNTAIA